MLPFTALDCNEVLISVMFVIREDIKMQPKSGEVCDIKVEFALFAADDVILWQHVGEE